MLVKNIFRKDTDFIKINIKKKYTLCIKHYELLLTLHHNKKSFKLKI